MYHLTVAEAHTFYVGDGQWLVHNAGCDLTSANFAQREYGEAFSKGGKFSGMTIDEVAAGIQNGSIRPEDVPIQYVVVDGKPVILNTRSSQALERAGIPRSQWNAKDVTNDPDAFRRYQNQINQSGLPPTGTPVTTPRGK